MKRTALVLLFLLISTNAFAAWTLTPTLLYRAGHYMKWQVLCTSDGDALSATDLVALMSDQMQREVQGSTLMILTVSPGTGGVIPDTTIDVTLSNDEAVAVYSETAITEAAVTTGLSLAADFNQYPTVFDKLYLTLSDIGTSGDQVTLVFDCWIENE